MIGGEVALLNNANEDVRAPNDNSVSSLSTTPTSPPDNDDDSNYMYNINGCAQSLIVSASKNNCAFIPNNYSISSHSDGANGLDSAASSPPNGHSWPSDITGSLSTSGTSISGMGREQNSGLANSYTTDWCIRQIINRPIIENGNTKCGQVDTCINGLNNTDNRNNSNFCGKNYSDTDAHGSSNVASIRPVNDTINGNNRNGSNNLQDGSTVSAAEGSALSNYNTSGSSYNKTNNKNNNKNDNISNIINNNHHSINCNDRNNGCSNKSSGSNIGGVYNNNSNIACSNTKNFIFNNDINNSSASNNNNRSNINNRNNSDNIYYGNNYSNNNNNYSNNANAKRISGSEVKNNHCEDNFISDINNNNNNNINNNNNNNTNNNNNSSNNNNNNTSNINSSSKGHCITDSKNMKTNHKGKNCTGNGSDAGRSGADTIKRNDSNHNINNNDINEKRKKIKEYNSNNYNGINNSCNINSNASYDNSSNAQNVNITNRPLLAPSNPPATGTIHNGGQTISSADAHILHRLDMNAQALIAIINRYGNMDNKENWFMLIALVVALVLPPKFRCVDEHENGTTIDTDNRCLAASNKTLINMICNRPDIARNMTRVIQALCSHLWSPQYAFAYLQTYILRLAQYIAAKCVHLSLQALYDLRGKGVAGITEDHRVMKSGACWVDEWGEESRWGTGRSIDGEYKTADKDEYEIHTMCGSKIGISERGIYEGFGNEDEILSICNVYSCTNNDSAGTSEKTIHNDNLGNIHKEVDDKNVLGVKITTNHCSRCVDILCVDILDLPEKHIWYPLAIGKNVIKTRGFYTQSRRDTSDDCIHLFFYYLKNSFKDEIHYCHMILNQNRPIGTNTDNDGNKNICNNSNVKNFDENPNFLYGVNAAHIFNYDYDYNAPFSDSSASTPIVSTASGHASGIFESDHTSSGSSDGALIKYEQIPIDSPFCVVPAKCKDYHADLHSPKGGVDRHIEGSNDYTICDEDDLAHDSTGNHDEPSSSDDDEDVAASTMSDDIILSNNNNDNVQYEKKSTVDASRFQSPKSFNSCGSKCDNNTSGDSCTSIKLGGNGQAGNLLGHFIKGDDSISHIVESNKCALNYNKDTLIAGTKKRQRKRNFTANANIANSDNSDNNISNNNNNNDNNNCNKNNNKSSSSSIYVGNLHHNINNDCSTGNECTTNLQLTNGNIVVSSCIPSTNDEEAAAKQFHTPAGKKSRNEKKRACNSTSLLNNRGLICNGINGCYGNSFENSVKSTEGNWTYNNINISSNIDTSSMNDNNNKISNNNSNSSCNTSNNNICNMNNTHNNSNMYNVINSNNTMNINDNNDTIINNNDNNIHSNFNMTLMNVHNNYNNMSNTNIVNNIGNNINNGNCNNNNINSTDDLKYAIDNGSSTIIGATSADKNSVSTHIADSPPDGVSNSQKLHSNNTEGIKKRKYIKSKNSSAEILPNNTLNFININDTNINNHNNSHYYDDNTNNNNNNNNETCYYGINNVDQRSTCVNPASTLSASCDDYSATRTTLGKIVSEGLEAGGETDFTALDKPHGVNNLHESEVVASDATIVGKIMKEGVSAKHWPDNSNTEVVGGSVQVSMYASTDIHCVNNNNIYKNVNLNNTNTNNNNHNDNNQHNPNHNYNNGDNNNNDIAIICNNDDNNNNHDNYNNINNMRHNVCSYNTGVNDTNNGINFSNKYSNINNIIINNNTNNVHNNNINFMNKNNNINIMNSNIHNIYSNNSNNNTNENNGNLTDVSTNNMMYNTRVNDGNINSACSATIQTKPVSPTTDNCTSPSPSLQGFHGPEGAHIGMEYQENGCTGYNDNNDNDCNSNEEYNDNASNYNNNCNNNNNNSNGNSNSNNGGDNNNDDDDINDKPSMNRSCKRRRDKKVECLPLKPGVLCQFIRENQVWFTQYVLRPEHEDRNDYTINDNAQLQMLRKLKSNISTDTVTKWYALHISNNQISPEHLGEDTLEFTYSTNINCLSYNDVKDLAITLPTGEGPPDSNDLVPFSEPVVICTRQFQVTYAEGELSSKTGIQNAKTRGKRKAMRYLKNCHMCYNDETTEGGADSRSSYYESCFNNSKSFSSLGSLSNIDLSQGSESQLRQETDKTSNGNNPYGNRDAYNDILESVFDMISSSTAINNPVSHDRYQERNVNQSADSIDSGNGYSTASFNGIGYRADTFLLNHGSGQQNGIADSNGIGNLYYNSNIFHADNESVNADSNELKRKKTSISSGRDDTVVDANEDDNGMYNGSNISSHWTTLHYLNNNGSNFY